MNKKKIMLKIINKENPYEYTGNCEIVKDIIKFNDNENSYLFDLCIERFIKENKKEKFILDFKNSDITINEDDKILKIPIEIIDKKIDFLNIDIKYKIDNNIINILIKEV